MNAKRLHHCWRSSFESRLELVCKLLRKRRPLTDTEVHDLRVALRRAQLLAALGSRTLGKGTAKRSRAALRAQLKSLHLVRDCDVALAWLKEANASDALQKDFQRRRTRSWQAARRILKAARLRKFKLPAGKKSDAKKFARKFEKQVNAAIRRCRESLPQGSAATLEQLHALRRTVRRWRYLRELELSRREVRRDRKLKTLIEVQDALGEVQNTKAILDQLKNLRATTELRALRTRLQTELGHHHSEARHAIPVLGQIL